MCLAILANSDEAIAVSCMYSSKMCWWNHDPQTEKENQLDDHFKCYTCSETFNNKARMMIHKKEKHMHLVRSCNLFIDDKCIFNAVSCWYVHDDVIEKEEEEEEERAKQVQKLYIDA